MDIVVPKTPMSYLVRSGLNQTADSTIRVQQAVSSGDPTIVHFEETTAPVFVVIA